MTDIRAEFELMMDQLCFPVFMIDVDAAGEFSFRALNAHHMAVTGLSNARVKGQKVRDVLPPRLAATITANYAKCVDSRAPYKYEELLNFETGEIWWLTTLSPVFDDRDVVVGVIGIAENITSYKERQFHALNSVVESKRLSEEISLFTGLAAHDLRGPLRQIRLVTELIEDGFVDMGDGKLELLTMVKQVSDTALEKLDEVLQHARSFMGETDTKTQVDFGHLCSDLVAILDPLSRIDVTYPDAHIVVESVALQVELRNILDNALKHASSKVLIELRTPETARRMLEIRVSDDGPGFTNPNDVIELMKSPPSDDRGFGLETVARLAMSRGGRVWMAEPEFGTGTTICWTIDAVLLDSAAGAAWDVPPQQA
ncbi:PAS domain-containing sensor histidine kinase [Hoeflea ulvae]|uniref:histidine kinase n=1 Tax=Hoeflea ulvae TaxID=2983764 RepID=A0ABT3YEZ5_9HYPH|nr:PAS domain-containing sensor histidine kinase [Hoeflea ulvae]MCY0094465.1 PAS domain-containing sensor histidine kinase [Hoeflea ulvae]